MRIGKSFLGCLACILLSINFVLVSSVQAANVISAEEAKRNYKAWKIDVKAKTRYRVDEDDQKRFQQEFRLRFKYNIENSDWEVIGIVRTGDDFNSSNDTFYDFDDGFDYDPEFNLTHFYLKNSNLNDGKLQIELGSIPSDKGLQKITALSSGGFIDGARVKVKTKLGEVTVAGGYLGSEDDPSIFDRDREFNYFEVSLKKEFLDKLGAEKLEVQVGAVHFADRNYFSQVVKARYKAFSDRVLTLVQEGLVDSEGEYKVGIGVEFDLMNLISGVEPKKDGIKIGIRYQHMSDDLGEYGHLTSGFYDVEGDSLILEVKRKWAISEDGRTMLEVGYRGRQSIDGEDEYRHEIFIGVTHSW